MLKVASWRRVLEGNSFIFISGSFFSHGGKVVPSAGNKVSEQQTCFTQSVETDVMKAVTLNVSVNQLLRCF